MIKTRRNSRPDLFNYFLSLTVLWIFAILVFNGCTTIPEQGSELDDSGQVISDKAGSNSLIVFVHGLNGHQWKTWNYDDGVDKFLWPQYMAEKDPDFQKADVFSFGYDSKCGPTERIPTVAGNLEASLNKKLSAREYQSISFVAHGMGGLVVREFILSHFDNLEQKAPLKSLVFLATPNGETEQAKLIHYLCKRPPSKKAESEEDKPAEKNYLESLEERWREKFEQDDSRKPFIISDGYEMV